MKSLCAVMTLIVLSAGVPADESTHSFTWDTLLAASVKLQTDYSYEANAESWIRVYQPDVWHYVRNDEFELEAQRLKGIERFRKQIEGFSLQQDMLLRTWVHVGKYNFDTQSFPVTDLDETYHWTQYRYSVGSFPTAFRLYLSNHELLSSIPMSPADARDFLNRRKNSRGEINRRLEVTLRIRLVGLKPYSKSDLLGEVQAARLFHDRNQKLVLKDIVKPSAATEPDQSEVEKSG